MLLLMFAFIFGGSIELSGGGEYIHYLLPGMMALAMMFGVETTMTTMANDTKKGITDRFRSMPIGDATPAVGGAGADMITSTVELAVLFLGGLLLGWRMSGSLAGGLLAIILLWWLRFAVLCLGIYLALTISRAEGARLRCRYWSGRSDSSRPNLCPSGWASSPPETQSPPPRQLPGSFLATQPVLPAEPSPNMRP